jgi:flagellar motor switch protein FliN/FliY
MERQNTMDWLAETWAACLGRAVEGMAGKPPALEWTGEEAAPVGALLWWEQGFDLLPQPAVWVGAPEETWNGVGSFALRATGVEDVKPEDARGAWLEILSQSLSAMAQAIGDRQERAVAAANGREIDAAPSECVFRTARLLCENAAPAIVRIAFSDALAGSLEDQAAGGGEQTALALAGQPDANPAPPPGELSRASRTLDLLRDVELPVSISFGRARMPLQEVLKLTPGSIVELDRAIDDPVALIVNDTVVALGEVVVIEGNYGLRIQKIMSRDHILRSSGVT